MTEQPRPTKPAASPPSGEGGLFGRFLTVVEWLGNLLPHPVTLFALFVLGIIVVSAIAAAMDLSVVDPRPVGARGRAEDGIIVARSLLSGDGIRWLCTNLVSNFTGFTPLGTVLVALLGVGVAERSGLLSATIRGLILAAPKNLVTVVIVFASIVSNTASEMGYVVIIPLAATIFHALGRHPIAGLAAAFAGVSGGYSANILIGTVDPLLAGITQEAAQFVDPEYVVHAAVNWYFMIASTFLITALGTWITVKIVEPRLGPYDAANADDAVDHDPSLAPLAPVERRALKWAGMSAILMVMLFIYAAGPRVPGFLLERMPSLEKIDVLLTSLPAAGILRDPLTGSLMPSPFLRSVVTMIFVFFVVPGFVYGRVAGTMRNDRDVIDAMAGAMSSMGLYIVLVFFAAQFVACFRETNLGSIMAVLGAEGLEAIGLKGPIVFIPFILMCGFVNLMLGSASAQWAITAPVFVPMLMYLGYAPEVIQAAYRIGDSTTNIITPMMSYFGLILAFAARYDKKLGIGTLISTMLPYSLIFFLGWVILFYVWVFLLGAPVGPGAPTYFEFAPAGG